MKIYRHIISLLAFAIMTSSCTSHESVEQPVFEVYDAEGENADIIEVGAAGMTGCRLRVMSGADWTLTVTEGKDWIKANPSAGPEGIREVKIDFDANTDPEPRRGRLDFTSGTESITIGVHQARGTASGVDPVPSDTPVADLLDVVFRSDGTAYDISPSQMEITLVEATSAVSYYNDTYRRYVSHFSHPLSQNIDGGFYKIDYTDNQEFMNALADGHTLETVFRMDYKPNGAEIKPFSSMASGGTGFLMTYSSKGTDMAFIANVSTDGKSSWKWAESGIVPEPGRYYHLVGVWNKKAGKVSVYVDGVLKGEAPTSGEFNFPLPGNRWFGIGADPLGHRARAAFNGDVAIARIYDDPLDAIDVTKLYDLVKNDLTYPVLPQDDLIYMPLATVAKGCWYHLYSGIFKEGDVLKLESVTNRDDYYICESVFTKGELKLRIPDGLTNGKYRIFVIRSGAEFPLGYTSLTVADKLPSAGRTRIVAHRGYHPGNIPENSIASLAEAQRLGVYGSELDVYITLDDVVVLYHDTTFRGTSDHPDNAAYKGLRPDSCTYDEIRNYRLCNGEYLPTLDEFLDQALKCPEVKVILEIKSHDTGEKNMRAVKACHEAVVRKGMQSQVEYISGNYSICKEVLRLDPTAMVQLVGGGKKPADVFKDGIRGIDYNYKKLYDEDILSAHELGMTVNVWTLNTVASMMEFMNKGVDLITTDEAELGMSVVGRDFVSY